jgi:hypothetical protein
MSELKRMPDNIQSPERVACGGGSTQPGGGISDVQPGTIFLHCSVFSELPNSVQLDAHPCGSWMMISNADTAEAEEKFIEEGWFFSAGAAIEASAFGCDSKVVERAVNRALQKATDDERGVLEITGVTLVQDSCLDYVSIFALARTIRRGPTPDLVGNEVGSTASEIAG